VADLQSHYHNEITDILKHKPYMTDGEYILKVQYTRVHTRAHARAHARKHTRTHSFGTIKATFQQHKHSRHCVADD
jgi:hypothetical protein